MEISSNLYSELCNVLSRCGSFSTDSNLQDIFVESRISPWRGDVPQANSRSERIEALISFLVDKQSRVGENALVLFLRVLYDRAHPGDGCKQELANLIGMLEKGMVTLSEAQTNALVNSRQADIIAKVQNKQQELAKYEQQLHRVKMQIASYGGEMSAPLAMLNQFEEIDAEIKKLRKELDNLQ